MPDPTIVGGSGNTHARHVLVVNEFSTLGGVETTLNTGSAAVALQSTADMNYQDRIVRDPRIAGGAPVLRGTRVTLKTVLASLAEGATSAEILADFPTLSDEDIRAAIAFAAASAQEDFPLAEIPVKR
jgi:uncharacterized protein (DUF433 family)